MADRQAFNIGGQEVEVGVPDDAIVTGAVVIVTYQRFHEDGGIGSGTSWAHSSIPHVQAVGMVRLAQIAIEDITS